MMVVVVDGIPDASSSSWPDEPSAETSGRQRVQSSSHGVGIVEIRLEIAFTLMMMTGCDGSRPSKKWK